MSGRSLKSNDANRKDRSQTMLPKTKVVVIYRYDRETQSIDLLKRCEAPCKEYRKYQRLWRLRDKERHTDTIIVCR